MSISVRHTLPRPRRLAPWPPRSPQARRVAPQRTSTAGYVYLIEAVGCGRLKIGHGKSATVRFAALRTASPFPLRLLRLIPTADSYALEQRLQRRYAAFQVHGEWFALPATILAALLQEEFV